MKWKDPGSKRLATSLVALLVAMGVAVRIAILVSPLREVDSDEAVVGLMARKLLDGDFTTFFWGQHYGGAHESVLVAVLLALRVPFLLAMRLVPILLFATAALLIWRIVRRLADEGAARLAGAIFWAFPVGMVWMSTKERGFYAASLALGLATALFALRLVDSWSSKDAALVGLCAGSAWYASPQSLYLLAPTAVWLIARVVRERRWRDAGRAAPFVVGGLIVGAAPWLVANARRGWKSFTVLPQPPTSYGFRLELFATRAVPVLAGFMDPFAPGWFGGRAGQAVLVVLLTGLVVAVATRWWRTRPRALTPFLLAVASYPLLFAAFPTSWFVNDPRYFTFFPAAAIVVVGWLMGSWRPWVRVAAVLFLVAVGIRGTVATLDYGDAYGRWDVAAGGLDPLVERLDDEGVDRVFADYWIAYRLGFETDERIIGAPIQDLRYEPYEAAVRDDPVPGFVFFDGTDADLALAAYLDRQQIAYRRLTVSRYAFYLPETRVLPEDVSADWYRIRLAKVPHLLAAPAVGFRLAT